jgi:hypothetical protein
MQHEYFRVPWQHSLQSRGCVLQMLHQSSEDGVLLSRLWIQWKTSSNEIRGCVRRGAEVISPVLTPPGDVISNFDPSSRSRDLFTIAENSVGQEFGSDMFSDSVRFELPGIST